MKRRDFITLLGGAATAPLWAPAVQAQPKVIRRVGFLGILETVERVVDE